MADAVRGDDRLDILGGDGAELVLMYPDDTNQWAEIETGVRGALDRETGRIVVPFNGPLAAEEVLRLLIGMVKRGNVDVWQESEEMP